VTSHAKRLYLVDGTALAYRSHFALARSGFTTVSGQPTGATYGFANTLRALIEKEKPDHLVVAFDAGGETQRHKELPTYKGTREKAPDEMVAQFPWIERVAAAYGAVVLKREGVEADDILATLARQGEREGYEVYLVTADKDFAQLVTDRIRMLVLSKPDQPAQFLGPAQVEEKFGVPPRHIVDYLALMGDASDNVPGVKGVGEKTAAELVRRFGAAEEVLARVAEIEKPKLREAVARDADAVRLAKRLVTLDDAVPDMPHAGELPDRRARVQELRELFKELQFNQLLRSLAAEEAAAPPSPPPVRAVGGEPGLFDREEAEAEAAEAAATPQPEREPGRRYVLVRTEAELDAMIEELSHCKLVAVDTETTGLDPLQATVVGISLSGSEKRAFYVPLNLDPPVLPGGVPEIASRLRVLLENPQIGKVGQNHKYDALALGQLDLHAKPLAFDTLLASYCVAPSGRAHNLDALALRYFGLVKIPTEALIGTGKKQITMAQVPVERVAEYACEDADVTLRLVEPLQRELAEAGTEVLFRDLEMPLLPVLTEMERRGARVDTAELARVAAEIAPEEARLEREIHELAGGPFKIGSVKELGAILFERMRLHEATGRKSPRRTKTGYSTDAEVLEELAAVAPIARKILDYRQLVKLRNTYLETLPTLVNPQTGRIHTTFRQTVAATGRLASDNPNLQNIPIRTAIGRQIRRAFVPEKGSVLISADYSQIELRLVAHFSGDPTLRGAFARGEDIHRRTASVVFGVAPELVTTEIRSRAKAINFGIIYGMGPQRLARETGMTVPEAKKFIETYFQRMPTVRAFLDEMLRLAQERGYAQTLAGRKRWIPELASEDPRVRVNAENIAVNTPIQGSAADIVKRAMIDLDAAMRAERMSGGMILQVHDELVLEVKAEEADRAAELTRKCMEGAVELTVPLKVDLGRGAHWLEAHG